MTNNQSRYPEMFADLEKKQQLAWIPFIMLGYPDMESSISFIESFIASGADALEIGIPFSDPVADGVLIQEAARVALEVGTRVETCFAALARVRENYPQIPIGLLTYANLVYRPGINNFYFNCQSSGVDSVLIADVPLCESEVFISAAETASVDAVFIAPPNASDKSLQDISKLKGGYTYVVSRAGVTGDNNKVKFPVNVVNSLLENNAPAPVLGFGISKPKHVRSAAFYGFKGVISGSAITRIISKNIAKEAKRVTNNKVGEVNSQAIMSINNKLKIFSQKMKIATHTGNSK